MFNRRAAFVMAAAVLAVSPLAHSQDAMPSMVLADEMVMGSEDAPITVIEYASLSCSHCADFHNNTFPEFKEKLIDTGQVRLVFREMLTGDPNFAGAAAVLVRCAGRERYFDAVKGVFDVQASIYETGGLRTGLLAVGADVGVTEEEFEACLANPEMTSGINNRMNRWVNVEGVRSTPTFEVNGQRVSGVLSYAELKAFIDEAAED